MKDESKTIAILQSKLKELESKLSTSADETIVKNSRTECTEHRSDLIMSKPSLDLNLTKREPHLVPKNQLNVGIGLRTYEEEKKYKNKDEEYSCKASGVDLTLLC